jgi:hypothetical protein
MLTIFFLAALECALNRSNPVSDLLPSQKARRDDSPGSEDATTPNLRSFPQKTHRREKAAIDDEDD